MRIKINKFEYERRFAETLYYFLENDLQKRKKLAHYTGVCDRTIRNWLHEKTRPSDYDLIILMQYSHIFFELVLEIVLGKDIAQEVIYSIRPKKIWLPKL